MADKNIVMDNAEMLMAVHGITAQEIAAADESGFVGERQIQNVGTVRYFITKRGNVAMPDQHGEGFRSRRP